MAEGGFDDFHKQDSGEKYSEFDNMGSEEL